MRPLKFLAMRQLPLCVQQEELVSVASYNNACTDAEYTVCKGSIEWVTKCMVSVETVGLCTGNVRSKEDRPIFSVPVARATAHRGGDGVEFPAAVH